LDSLKIINQFGVIFLVEEVLRGRVDVRNGRPMSGRGRFGRVAISFEAVKPHSLHSSMSLKGTMR
jgi:hypothetical protein